MVKSRRAFLAALAAAAIIGAGTAAAQFGEPISRFSAEDIWLVEKPRANARSATRRIERVKASSLGPVEEIFITAYFPWNGVVGLSLGDGRVVYVEYANVEPVNKVSVAREMNSDVPPGTCKSVASAEQGGDPKRKSGVRRGFGGC